eukprot:Skav200896  [mRNA]  locus=scaffold1581:171508:174646:+ [translate_table: standard]
MAVREVMDSINSVCRSRGGHYAGYSSCQVVSWDDVSRGTVGGSLSCWGANITDTYLKSKKSGTRLFTVRSDNWNEKLGAVSADEIAVVAGAGGRGPVQPVTLQSVLQSLGHFGGYAGLDPGTNLFDSSLDAKCSIRFQTTFIPVEDSGSAPGKLEFATEAYNYNTMDDSDPRNLVLLCTSQGVAVQQDGCGAKKLFHHAVDDVGRIHRYWLEAEESKHKVGGEQRETEEERAEALARGKATSSVIGVRAMGQRFNVLMTIQVPLQQSRSVPKAPTFWTMLEGSNPWKAASKKKSKKESSKESSLFSQFSGAKSVMYCADADGERDRCSRRRLGLSARSSDSSGQSTAARVSRGSEYDTWPGLSVSTVSRNASEHVTVTVVLYNAVKGGVPSEGDVIAAIDDLESLYRACSETGKLADSTFDFMKQPLKVDDVNQIAAKVVYQPPPVQVLGYDQFPTA